MACYTCKNKSTGAVEEQGEGTNILLRVFYFLIGVIVITILTPVIALIGVYMLFNTVILDKGTEIMPSLSLAAQLLRKATNKRDDDEDEEEDDDDEELNPEDYELIGVEEIESKNV